MTMKKLLLMAVLVSGLGIAYASTTVDKEDHVTLETIPHVVTTDIKVGIEKHIEDLSIENGGFFPISFEGKEMKLKLVRVHMEYLANLGPRRHFACVDLATEDGNVYDLSLIHI